MSAVFSEQLVEESAVAWFGSAGYAIENGDAVREGSHAAEPFTEILIPHRVTAAVQRLNSHLDDEGLAEVVRVVQRAPNVTLVENNRWMHALIVDGVEVEYVDPRTGDKRLGRARLVDFDNVENNDFLVVRQLTIAGAGGTFVRPDLLVYVNGLPLAVIELKDPSEESADLWSAIDQIDRYKGEVPDLFVPNVVNVASDGLLTRVGSVTSSPQRFMPWRSVGGGEPTIEALITGLFAPSSFLDYVRNCVVFEEDERGKIEKKIAGYHQFRVLRRARAQVIGALRPPSGMNTTDDAGKGGVVWHTQGSGKSLTMLMLAGALIREPIMANPTIVVVTDRNDLDDQLFGTFVRGRALLRQTPIQAESREDLKRVLDRASGGVIFTTIHKFTEAHGVISDRSNVAVLADEAHRSQYGFEDGGARWMRDSLPNATFVGFTGTPLDRDDRSTPRVFGDYSDIYDIRQAVEDGATKPIYYESRVVRLALDEEGVSVAEQRLAEATNASATGADLAENIRVPLEVLVGAQDRVQRIAEFVVDHWEKRRAAMEGKAMIVCMSRDIAARVYEAIRLLRPDWHDADDQKGFMKVVISAGAEDPERIRQHVRTKAQRKSIGQRFKDPSDDFRLVIVCDMWLTGFDCPPMHTMYLDKPLAGHNLMQAIARVNRVFGDKPGGLVVDLIGLADQLADALATYVQAGGKGEAVKSLQDDAVPEMESAFEKLRAFFHGYNYSAALDVDQRTALRVYLGAIDHIYAQEDGWRRFRNLVKELAVSFALSVPRPETRRIAPHLVFFQRVQVMIRKRLADERESSANYRPQDISAAVRQVIGTAVDAGDVIDLFAASGLDEARLDILSDEFLSRVAALEQKNLALETLRKLLTDQIRSTERTNLVQSKRFREALEDAMVSYTNKAITTAEMIARLLELAKWVRDVQHRGESLGLTPQEAAFYDAVADNESARAAIANDTLRLLARELAEMVKRMPKLDWTQRESVRADLRRSVRRLLARYGYPPDLSEDATQLVLKQAELSTMFA